MIKVILGLGSNTKYEEITNEFISLYDNLDISLDISDECLYEVIDECIYRAASVNRWLRPGTRWILFPRTSGWSRLNNVKRRG